MDFDADRHPHRRWNPLVREWVLVSPHRTQRPWQGQEDVPDAGGRPAHDPACYLCPGNGRAGGATNPAYTGTHVFANDFPALLDAPLPSLSAVPEVSEAQAGDALMQAQPVAGECRVICFSPRHDLTLPELPLDAISEVVALWRTQYLELAQRWAWVQLFENKGAVMGCSNPHPHGQVWATDHLPNEALAEDTAQRDYLAAQGTPLLVDYAAREATDGARTVDEDDHWIVVVPWWALWPFELLVLPKRHVRHMGELSADEERALAALLQRCLARCDRLFGTSFPYSFGWHQAPGRGHGGGDHWQLHGHLYPPLLRSATVKKFMVGYELLSEGQRDLTAEQAAARLRAV